MKYKHDHIIMGSTYGDEYGYDATSAERVKNLLKKVNENK
jgi:predicted P-loop ATPase